MRRTQHGISAVSPSHGRVYGLRYVAIRVLFSGKFSSSPSEIQSRGSRLSTKLANTKPINGTASASPAATFSATPALKSQSRLLGCLSCPFSPLISMLPLPSCQSMQDTPPDPQCPVHSTAARDLIRDNPACPNPDVPPRSMSVNSASLSAPDRPARSAVPPRRPLHGTQNKCVKKVCLRASHCLLRRLLHM